MTSDSPSRRASPRFPLRLPLLGALLLTLAGCQDNQKMQDLMNENAELRAQNGILQVKLQDVQGKLTAMQTQITNLQGDVAKAKDDVAAAKAAPPAPRPVSTAAAPAPTGPAPANLPYSLYSGLISTTKGEEILLTGVSFGKIDRIPLQLNGGTVEVSMSKVRYIRRRGKPDESKNIPVTLTMKNDEEIRAVLTAANVSGVDARLGTKIEIPFSTVIEMEIK